MKHRYNEPSILRSIRDYLDSTYQQHYSGKGVQVLDLLESSECVSGYLRGSAIKYLSRYGKKGGKNPKDLMKAVHCTMLLMHFEGKNEQD